MKPNPKVDSALHVLKGAVEKVLQTPLTTSVYAEGNKGRLTVEYDKSPTVEQMREIEALANSKISEDAPISHFEMARGDAEAKFGNAIYDKFPVPAHITQLKILQIPGWNVNCCINQHLEKTGGIGSLKILSHRARPGRRELEISFEVI
jgi:alanyl-tRNA synthetase